MRVAFLVLSVLSLSSACFEPELEGRRCARGSDCISGYVCVDSTCTIETVRLDGGVAIVDAAAGPDASLPDAGSFVDAGSVVDAGPDGGGVLEDDAGSIPALIACSPVTAFTSSRFTLCLRPTWIGGRSAGGDLAIHSNGGFTPLERTALTGGSYEVR